MCIILIYNLTQKMYTFRKKWKKNNLNLNEKIN